ncbi:alpha/beta hydrolase [Agrobacterium vitis]|uniref:Alpha/beta fold hydrolase n=1 Tax=Agrobacterium vitis TaxID=373 RepID=A0AAE5AVE1_AGRVI|nr:alpha/beta hydrolase [Agrobacterium vitis]MCF1501752.1 alpha/beta hydrolase [Allorhizobium sp. Av2]MCM2438741.1 alpha/beta hydrolase [Agrobacterium vitis]MUZ56980.1 alpha/beta fold hydrolase [Agrobacterium vitis]MVA69158.1 alpha/beta fold hydrolase [Agrobacterium vitis]MVA85884.1 alpha/beta fold hydrolase [Agrobacterium vitis]
MNNLSAADNLAAPQSHHADVNGIRLHYIELGEGPAVIFCHGFPETWRSWCHQISALAMAGYRAIALDMRGHGGSDCPDDLADYSVIHTVGDVIGLMDVLQIPKAVIVGHDAGTTTAYNAALMRPDRFYGVMALSIPFMPRPQRNMMNAMIAAAPPGFYMRYFQSPAAPEKELDADPRETLRRIYFHNSGDNPAGPSGMETDASGHLLPSLATPDGEMTFLPDDELDQAANDYRRTGFRGGLNGYRVFDLNWKLTAPWSDMALTVPATFIGGDRDIVMHFPGFRQAAEAMPQAEFVKTAGHWIQKEAPAAVNAHLLRFLRQVLPAG